MKICKNCGFQNNDQYSFCVRCGTSLSENQGRKRSGSGNKNNKALIRLLLFMIIVLGLGVFVYLRMSDGSGLTGAKDKSSYKSTHIVEYDGQVYTSYQVDKQDWKVIDDDYHSSFIIHDDQIYMRKIQGDDDQKAQLLQMNLDGNNRKVLAENVTTRYGLRLYNNKLYFAVVTADGTIGRRSVNLKDLTISQSERYHIEDVSDDVWILSGTGGDRLGKVFQCKPGFEDVEQLKGVPDGECLGYYDGRVYFQDRDSESYPIYSYDIESGSFSTLVEGYDEDGTLSNGNIYYADKTDTGTILHRIDLSDNNAEYEYELNNVDLYMKGCFYQIENKLYVMRFARDNMERNTEIIELNLDNSEYGVVGGWLNTEIRDNYIAEAENGLRMYIQNGNYIADVGNMSNLAYALYDVDGDQLEEMIIRGTGSNGVYDYLLYRYTSGAVESVGSADSYVDGNGEYSYTDQSEIITVNQEKTSYWDLFQENKAFLYFTDI